MILISNTIIHITICEEATFSPSLPSIIFTADFIPSFFEVRYGSIDWPEKSGNLPIPEKEKLLGLPAQTKTMPEMDDWKSIKT